MFLYGSTPQKCSTSFLSSCEPFWSFISASFFPPEKFWWLKDVLLRVIRWRLYDLPLDFRKCYKFLPSGFLLFPPLPSSTWIATSWSTYECLEVRHSVVGTAGMGSSPSWCPFTGRDPDVNRFPSTPWQECGNTGPVEVSGFVHPVHCAPLTQGLLWFV